MRTSVSRYSSGALQIKHSSFNGCFLPSKPGMSKQIIAQSKQIRKKFVSRWDNPSADMLPRRNLFSNGHSSDIMKTAPDNPRRFWQREKDSNPHIRSQSPLCYLYTIPLNARAIIQKKRSLSRTFLPSFAALSLARKGAGEGEKDFAYSTASRRTLSTPPTRSTAPSTGSDQKSSTLRFDATRAHRPA